MIVTLRVEEGVLICAVCRLRRGHLALPQLLLQVRSARRSNLVINLLIDLVMIKGLGVR